MASGQQCCRQCGTPYLTDRQLEVVRTLTAHPEATNRELAKRLYMSVHTLKGHLSAIYRRLGVSTRSGCILACIILGVVELEEVVQEWTGPWNVLL